MHQHSSKKPSLKLLCAAIVPFDVRLHSKQVKLSFRHIMQKHRKCIRLLTKICQEYRYIAAIDLIYVDP